MMFLSGKSFFFLCFIFLLLRVIKSDHVHLLNDEFLAVENPFYCIRESFIYFRNEVYKICIHKGEGMDSKLNIYIQKKRENLWEVQTELFQDSRKTKLPSFFSYVVDEEMIIIFCEITGYEVKRKFDCTRSVSSTGIDFKTEKVVLPYDLMKNKNITFYSSAPFSFTNHKYLLICGIYNSALKSPKQGNFINCAGSNDKGLNWKTKFLFHYDNIEDYTTYFLLKPKIHDNKLGFFFNYVSSSGESGKYIECEHKSNQDFNCKDVDFIKKDKALRDVIKVNDYYITSYANKNSSAVCYLYYSNENSLLLKPRNTGEDYIGCYRGTFMKLDGNKILFMYSSGNGIYNLYTFRPNSYA
ncbi:cysteine-rich protective antigen, putative [Plasmodium gallinaceum]|uniref:Cysteine-rich protective antigen, putative n=1 Tax=Plasmodium gallinaceum TaxID=5849 RepID=A0A1J1GSP5_PLAGA|nr:cysteine-rich protective antigen, putative [Plasmodium gallinaceum]CRG94067.1 cysteine-rich protective antigen, putative [Plasmodium gallinaceum]